MRSPLVIALGILAIGLVVLLISGDGSSILGLDADRFANLIYGGALLVVLGSAALWRSGLTDRLRNLALWLFIILALVAGYQYRYELQDVAIAGHGRARARKPALGHRWRRPHHRDAGSAAMTATSRRARWCRESRPRFWSIRARRPRC